MAAVKVPQRARQDVMAPVPVAQFFVDMTTKRKYYAVIRGFATEVYNSWQECESQVKGYIRQIYTSFKTQAEAERCFAQGMERAEIHALHGHQFVGMGRDAMGLEIFRCDYCLVTQ
ncbi:unnamed protein product [Calypogeia fissa]